MEEHAPSTLVPTCTGLATEAACNAATVLARINGIPETDPAALKCGDKLSYSACYWFASTHGCYAYSGTQPNTVACR